MARYLVGMGSNTWDFDQAYKAAQNGDVIQFEKGFEYHLQGGQRYIINKDITICGWLEVIDGTRTVFSEFYGGFIVRNNTKLNLENICVYSNGNNRTISVDKGGEVIIKNSIIGNKFSGNNMYLIYNDGGELNVDDVILESVDDKVGGIGLENNSKSIIKNTAVSSIYMENSELYFSNGEIINHFGNGINSKNSKIEIDNTYIEGSAVDVEKRYPIVWGSNSKIIIKSSTIKQPNYEAAIFTNDNSELDLEDVGATSIKIYRTRMEANDVVISEILSINEKSLVAIENDIEVLGEWSEKIDMYVGDYSVISANILELNRVSNPNIRVANNSCVRIKELRYEDGNISDLNFDVDESSSIEKPEIESEKDIAEKVSAREQLDNLIGLKKVKTEIEKMLRMVDFNNKRIEQGLSPEKQALHSVFVGNPGTGKTTVARLIGEVLSEKGAISENKLIEVSRTDLVATHIGQIAPKTRAVLERALGGVLFIDEAYTLNSKSTNDFGKEAIDEILKFMEDHRDDIVIIFAGYTKEMDQFLKINPGLKSRVPNTFDFEDYSPEEISEIGAKYFESKLYVLEDEEYYKSSVKREYKATLDKSNARWIRNINEAIFKTLSNRVYENDEEDVSTIKNVDIDEVMNSSKFKDDDTKRNAMDELNKLIGISKVKEQVNNFVALAEMNKKRAEQGKETSAFSLHSLFLGNPGSGKTTVARIVGEILYQKGVIPQNKLVEVSRTDLVGSYIGHTAPKTREVLESALGGVLFIDEAYTLKGSSSNDFGQEAIDEILKFMEDHRQDIVIIFAGYTKEMSEFLNMNSGLRSRIPNTFDFEDYTADEIVKIGLLGLDKYGYTLDREYYSEVVSDLYNNNDGSNGRWVRNINEKIITYMSMRVAREGSDNFDEITNEDINKLKENIYDK